MCAIAGTCGSRNASADPCVLEKMIQMVRHRGPDDWGVYADREIGLANARLSIIDLRDGHQPMHNEDESLWITFNGEIFNYLELREQLIRRGHRFTSKSDTEVILHLYEEEGEDCVRQLNGQWAFAIWDARERQLFLSRDRLGVRPLFYAPADGGLVFASEIKSILAHPAIHPELDLQALDQIFTFWFTLPPKTIFKGISELAPGHSLIFRDHTTSVFPHWQIDFRQSSERNSDEHEYGEQLESLLADATRIRLRSDVPVGAYLSGGLDSTIITALINQTTTAQLRTFSIGFDAKHLDERPFQQEAVAFLKTAHEQIGCGYRDIAAAFPEVIWYTEKPVIRAAPAPMYLLSRLFRYEGFKVVLTGEGADEVFGGYDIYKEAKIRRFWASQLDSKQRPRLLRRLYPYQDNLQRQPDVYLQKFFRVRPEDVNHPFFSHLPRWEMTAKIKTFLSEDVQAGLSHYDAVQDLLDRLPCEYFRWDRFSQAQYLETAFLLPGYILSSQGDRVALANSVEARHPFLDYRIVEFAAKLPATLKMKVLNEKYILKRTFGHLLPAGIVDRPKQPYRAPDGKSFFAGAKHDYFEEAMAPRTLNASGVFDSRAVGKLIDKFEGGRALGVRDDMALIGILSTQLVIDQFISNFRQGGQPWTESKQSCVCS